MVLNQKPLLGATRYAEPAMSLPDKSGHQLKQRAVLGELGKT